MALGYSAETASPYLRSVNFLLEGHQTSFQKRQKLEEFFSHNFSHMSSKNLLNIHKIFKYLLLDITKLVQVITSNL